MMKFPALLVPLVLCGCVHATSNDLQQQCVVSDLKIALTSHYNQSGHWQSDVEFVQGHRDSQTSNQWQTEVEQRTEDCGEDDTKLLRTIIHLKAPVGVRRRRVEVPVGYERVGDVGVVKRSSAPRSLSGAIKDCARDGAVLLVTDSEAKLKFVKEFMSNPETYKGASNEKDMWTGVQVVAGEWRTGQGVPLQDVPVFLWHTGRPVDGHCAVYAKQLHAHWDSNACAYPNARLPFICEIPT